MNKVNIPYRYDVVGSFLRPKTLSNARKAYFANEISDLKLNQIENEMIKDLVKKQLDHGLRNITDGEFRRQSWHMDFFQGINGIEATSVGNNISTFTENKLNEVPHAESLAKNGIELIRTISGENHPFIKHYQYLHELVKELANNQAVARISAPSPSRFYYELIHIARHRQSIQEIYTNEEALFDDIVKTYRQYVADLYAVGCRNIQFDDTTWITLVDNNSFNRVFGDFNGDPAFLKQKLAENYVELNNRVLQDQPQDITFSTHTCRGNFRSQWASQGAYDKIADYLFGQQLFDAYFLEYDTERAGGFEPLAKVKANVKVILGLVTTKTPELEEKESLIQRIEEASKYIDKDKICLGPQCGFASTEEGNLITEADQWKKNRFNS